MLVTRAGRTTDDPCGAFCIVSDYDDWRDVALQIQEEVSRRWQNVLPLERERFFEGGTRFPDREQLVFLDNEFQASVDDLDHPLVESAKFSGELGWRGSVDRAVQAAERGACVMELLDQMTTYYEGKTLPSPPDRGSWVKWAVAGTAATIALVGGGYYLARRYRTALPRSTDRPTA
jgi:hypothetical protein